MVRELVYGGRRFNEIQRGVPLMSSSLLSKRLRTLEDAGIVRRERGENGVEYVLTPAGSELRPIVEAMGVWGERWLRREITREDADPAHLMWAIRGTVRLDSLPEERAVVHFRFPTAVDAKRYWWLVLQRPASDLCITDPGFKVDLTVHSEPVALARVLAGDTTLATALEGGEIQLEGQDAARRAFRDWFGLSPFAGVTRRPARAAEPRRPRRRARSRPASPPPPPSG